MTATLDKAVRGTISFDGQNGKFDDTYVYKGLAVGESIYQNPDLPPLDHVVVIENVEYFATGYDQTPYFDPTTGVDANGEVVVHYSTPSTGGTFKTADYTAWEMSYQKEAVRIPTFALQARYYNKAGETNTSTRWDWVEQGLSVPVKYSTLNVTVNHVAASLADRQTIFNIMAAISAQEDHLHIISQFGAKKWVMQPAQMRQADAFRVEISYHWISDPGNGAIAIPQSVLAADPDVKKYIHIPKIERPPFHQYMVRPQLEIVEDPSETYPIKKAPGVYVVDLYPQSLPGGGTNPRYDPNGYKSLPGKPIP